MTDPASPAAVTEERIEEIRKFVAPLTRDDLPPESWIAWYRDLLAALDARGLELARLKEKVSTGIREHARTIQFKLDAEREWTKFERRAHAAEARLAQANEALEKIEGMSVPDQPAAFALSRETYLMRWVAKLRGVARDALKDRPTPPAQSAGEALDPAGTGEGVTDGEVQLAISYLGVSFSAAQKARRQARERGYWLPDDETSDAWIVRLLSRMSAERAAQASALAEARRSALEEAAELVEGFDVAPTGEDVRSDVALALVRRDLALAEAIRALTEPQHGNG